MNEGIKFVEKFDVIYKCRLCGQEAEGKQGMKDCNYKPCDKTHIM